MWAKSARGGKRAMPPTNPGTGRQHGPKARQIRVRNGVIRWLELKTLSASRATASPLVALRRILHTLCYPEPSDTPLGPQVGLPGSSAAGSCRRKSIAGQTAPCAQVWLRKLGKVLVALAVKRGDRALRT